MYHRKSCFILIFNTAWFNILSIHFFSTAMKTFFLYTTAINYSFCWHSWARLVANMFLSHCFWNSFWCNGYPTFIDSPVQLVTAHAEYTVNMLNLLNFKFMSIKRPVSPQLHQLSTRHDNNTSCNPQQINHFIQICNTIKDGTSVQLWQDFLIHEPPVYYQIYYAIDIKWGRS